MNVFLSRAEIEVEDAASLLRTLKRAVAVKKDANILVLEDSGDSAQEKVEKDDIGITVLNNALSCLGLGQPTRRIS